MSELEVTVPAKKEIAVLSDASLLMIARHIAQDKPNGLVLAMMLNIPTATIVDCIYNVTGDGVDRENEDCISITEQCVMIWKEMTESAKPKERVKYMERALREMGKADIADVFVEQARENQELNLSSFQ